MDQLTQALKHFTEQYFALWQDAHACLPQSEQYLDLPSPCVVQQSSHYVVWQVVEREKLIDFSNIETALNLTLNQNIKHFYGSQFSADMKATFKDLSLTLIQVWNDEDLARLQENLIGHLLMQKKLKQPLTVFIATTDDELEIISLDNQTGEIIKERIGTKEREILAPTFAEFLQALTPEM